jgi:3',5'-cyclic AMP phosphodiesterase CpdA
MRLIHITDPHLTSLASIRFGSLSGKRRSGYLSWRKNRQHRHRPEVLEILRQSLLADAPDWILLTGDLLHIGLEAEAMEAGEWLRSLGPPERVLVIPGNHDIYAPDSAALIERHWKAYLPKGGYPFCRDEDGLRVIGLNSAVVTPIFSARGEIGAAQLSALPGALSRERFNVVMIHHPPLPGMTKWRKSLRDAAALGQLFRAHPPDLVLYGHIHRNRSGAKGSTRLYGTASASGSPGAAYRVFDVDRSADGWSVRMQLKTIVFESGQGKNVLVSEQAAWTVARQDRGL